MSRSMASLLTLLALVLTASFGCESTEEGTSKVGKVNVTPTKKVGGKMVGGNKQTPSFKVQMPE